MMWMSCLLASAAATVQEHDQSSGQLDQQVAQILERTESGWAAADKLALQQHIARLRMTPQQQDMLLTELPRLLSCWRPEVLPVFSGNLEPWNARIPIPEELARRERVALLAVLKQEIDSGLAGTAPSAAERDQIYNQIDYLIEETRKAVLAGVRGDDAREVLDKGLKSVRAFARSTVGQPFQSGIDRPLSAVELQEVVARIQQDAAALVGVEVKLVPETSDEYACRVALRDMIGTLGHGRVLCHPEVFRQIRELEAIRNEYYEIRRVASEALRSELGDRERAVWETIARTNRDRLRRRAPSVLLDGAEPWAASRETPPMSRAPEPVVTRRIRTVCGVIAGLVAVTLALLLVAAAKRARPRT